MYLHESEMNSSFVSVFLAYELIFCAFVPVLSTVYSVASVHFKFIFDTSLVLNPDLFVFILKHSFSDVMGDTKGKKIGTLCCRGLKPLVIMGYAAVFSYWFRTFGHAEQYSKAIITSEDGSQWVIPNGNPMSSPGKL